MFFKWLLAVCALVSCVQAQQDGGSDSVTNEISDCVCVPFTHCRDNGTVDPYGAAVVSPRIDDGECSCKSCDIMTMACCRLEKIITTVRPTPPTDRPTPPTARPTTPTARPTTPTARPTPPTVPPTNGSVNSCGQRNIGGVTPSRILSTEEDRSSFGEFPWVVAIFLETQVQGRKRNIYQCVGSLVDPSVVLTAAHCVEGKAPLGVRAGEWDVLVSNESLPDQNRAVKSIILHEEYVPRLLHNGLALLILESPVELAPHVGTICLPDQDERMDGRNCVVTGWGKDKFEKDGRNQRILKKVDLPIVSRSQCQEALRNVRFGPNFTLHPTFLCAGGELGKDTCKGDGGGPLACPVSGSPNKYVQAGITAWGVGCGGTTPGVYIDVARYRNWIDNKIIIAKMDTRSDD